MSLFASINKTADAPAVDVYAEELERERARRAAQAQLDAEEAAEKARVEKAEAEAEAIRKANEPKHYNKADLVGAYYRSRLLGYPAMAATTLLGIAGTIGAGDLAIGANSIPLNEWGAFAGVAAVSTFVAYKISKWLIGKRNLCKVCGTKNNFDVKVEVDGEFVSNEGDYNRYRDVTVTTCNNCKSYNRLSETYRAKTAEAKARDERAYNVEKDLKDAERAAERAISARRTAKGQYDYDRAARYEAQAAAARTRATTR